MGSALRSLNLILEEPERRKRIRQNYKYLNSKLQELGFNTGNSISQIIPIKIGDDILTKKVVYQLLKNNIYTCGITYPGVKLNDARIRLGILATHTKDDLDYLLNTLVRIDQKLHIRK